MNRGIINRALAASIITVGTAIWAAEQPVAPVPATNAPVASAATNGIGPKIQFETMVHDFGQVKSGEQVKYTYTFTNAGDQLLELTGMQRVPQTPMSIVAGKANTFNCGAPLDIKVSAARVSATSQIMLGQDTGNAKDNSNKMLRINANVAG